MRVFKYLLMLVFIVCVSQAKEPTNWMFGVGAGVGGVSIFSKALDVYSSQYTDRVPNSTNSIYKDEGKVYKHHLNAAVVDLSTF